MSNSEKTSVLLVEDSAPVRQRLSALLSESPRLRVIGAAPNAAEALRLFHAAQPDAVVLDLQLPDGDGLEVLNCMKQERASCVVVILTNFALPEFRQRCAELGADFFLNKAKEFERVVEVLEALSRAGPNTSRCPTLNTEAGPSLCNPNPSK